MEMFRNILCASSLLALAVGSALATEPSAQLVQDVLPQITAWRRDLHQHPELSNREVRTSKIVAEELQRLGYEVRIGIAHTGVVGILKGGKPGPKLAIRADMDALPVTEQVDLPFASKTMGEYLGKTVGVMHACGHDAHTAMTLGLANILAKLRPDLPGEVMLIFQPAEEGAPPGEEGGAPLMVRTACSAISSPMPCSACTWSVRSRSVRSACAPVVRWRAPTRSASSCMA